MQQGNRNAESWQDVQRECHELLDGILRRMGEKRGFRPDGTIPSFGLREDLADRLGREIAGFLLEKSLAADRALQQQEILEKVPCPRCGKWASRLKDKSGAFRYERLMIESKVGPVPVDAPLFHCWKCRKNVSPLQGFALSERPNPQQPSPTKDQLGRR